MSNWGDAIAGLKTQLEAQIPGLQAFAYPTDQIAQYPTAVILPEAIDTEIAFQGNTFEADLRVVVMVCSGDSAEGFTQLYDYIDPTTASKSIIKAVRMDRTLGGKVDDADVTRIENIGRRQIGGGFQFGFDALVHFIKSVA